ncbi:MAG: ABC transporter permease [Actinomycetota bacterium]|nr:ABC transporter permease [Actinomycetota bacterium]
MSAVSLAVHQMRYEQKAYWRNPASAFFTFAFPIMFMVIFASLNSGTRIPFLGDIPFNQYYIPAITAFAVISACYSNLGVTLALRRDSGALKRLRGTPLPAGSFIGGVIGNSLVVSTILIAITLAFGTGVYGLRWHGHLLALALTFLLGAACFCALGIAVSMLVPNADAAPAIVNFAIFPVLFLSGTFFPIPGTATITRVADYLPVRPFTQAMFAAFDPRTRGLGFDGRSLLVLSVWLVAGVAVAVRRFRWEPRRS